MVYNSIALSANRSASSAIKPFGSNSPNIPSAAMDVITQGVPFNIASISLPFKPAPKRKGAKHTLAFCITKLAFSANPLITNPFFILFN